MRNLGTSSAALQVFQEGVFLDFGSTNATFHILIKFSRFSVVAQEEFGQLGWFWRHVKHEGGGLSGICKKHKMEADLSEILSSKHVSYRKMERLVFQRRIRRFSHFQLLKIMRGD